MWAFIWFIMGKETGKGFGKARGNHWHFIYENNVN